MAELRKTSGGMIEITKSRQEKQRALSLGVIADMGELIDLVKDQEARLAKLEGKSENQPIVLSMEKKLEKLKKI